MQEVDGFLLMVTHSLGLPIMDAPMRYRDQAKNAADFLEWFRISKKNTDDPEQWNQPSWCPVQELDTAESICDVLAGDKQASNHHGRDTEPCSDRLQLRWETHWFVTGTERQLESGAPSIHHAR